MRSLERLDLDRLVDGAVWLIVALVAWRFLSAARLDSWREGFRAGFNAAPIGARRTPQEVSV
jgi:hypothetical protein